MSVPFQAIECYLSSVIPLNGNKLLAAVDSVQLTCYSIV